MGEITKNNKLQKMVKLLYNKVCFMNIQAKQNNIIKKMSLQQQAAEQAIFNI